MKALISLFLGLIAFISVCAHAATPKEVADMAMEGYRLFTRDSLNDDRAKGYAMMLDAAWEGDAKAANNIGWLLEQGIFVDKDLQAALRWYERASDQGLPAAALNYTSILFHHPEVLEGRQPDIERLANAAFTAGVALTMGRGLHYDYRQGEELLIRAALLGNDNAAMTIAQQLEMYPDSFSYLPLEKIINECDAILPEGNCHRAPVNSDLNELTEQMLTPGFWYKRISHTVLQHDFPEYDTTH
ncbi:MAG: hypothetical protein NC095_02990 [Muribaculum sp.]|nr:hypothetical protein [Muribaculum sp.]